MGAFRTAGFVSATLENTRSCCFSWSRLRRKISIHLVTVLLPFVFWCRISFDGFILALGTAFEQSTDSELLIFELRPFSGILKGREHDVSETGYVFCLSWGGDTYSVGFLTES
jgi:hypothetical protein